MSWITKLFPSEKYSDEEIAFQEKLKLCDKSTDAVFRLIMDLAETHIYQERVVSAFRPDSIESNWSWYRILWVAKDADPKGKRSIRWLISSGALRHAHDLEFLLSLHHGILKRVAETFAKYESLYWLINIMLSHGLIDDPKALKCQLGLRNCIRIDAPVELTELALLKTASGRLIDAKEFRYRMRHAWQKTIKVALLC